MPLPCFPRLLNSHSARVLPHSLITQVNAYLQFTRDHASKIEAHEAEKGIFKRLLPMGLAAMKVYFAQHGTGDVGPDITWADGVDLPRERKPRERDYFSLFGKFAVAQTCYRAPGEPGIFPLDTEFNRPERCARTSCKRGVSLKSTQNGHAQTKYTAAGV